MPPTAPPERFAQWESRVQQHVSLLQSVLDDCHRQRELITAGDMTGLMRLLSDKGRRVEQLHADAAEINRQYGGGSDADPTPDATTERRVALRDRCQQLGAEILELERLCEAELAASRDRTTEQIQALHQSTDATARYRSMDAAAEGGVGGSIDFQCG